MAINLFGKLGSGLGISPELMQLLDSKNVKTDKYEKYTGRVLSAYKDQVKAYNEEEIYKNKFDFVS